MNNKCYSFVCIVVLYLVEQRSTDVIVLLCRKSIPFSWITLCCFLPIGSVIYFCYSRILPKCHISHELGGAYPLVMTFIQCSFLLLARSSILQEAVRMVLNEEHGL